MDKKLTGATIPLSPSEINRYCKANAAGNNDIIYNFDISECELSHSHILGYLSNLKIDFRVSNFTGDFLIEYMRTPFFVGRSNLIDHHKRAIREQLIDQDIVSQHRALILSIPLFLVMSSNASEARKQLLTQEVFATDDVLPSIGPNFAHLVNDSEFIIGQLRENLFTFSGRPYYTHYFNEYIYGGERLINFFNQDVDSLLAKALIPVLEE